MWECRFRFFPVRRQRKRRKRLSGPSRERSRIPAPHKGEKLDRSITRLSIGGGRKSKMRSGDIVGAVCSIEGVDAEDIGIIDIRESLTFVEILNRKGSQVLAGLQDRTIKGKIRKVRITSQNNGV